MPNFFKQGAVDLAAPGGGDMTLIQHLTGTGAAGDLVFSDIPQTFRNLRLISSARSIATSLVMGWVQVRINGDATAIYDWTMLEHTGATAAAPEATVGQTVGYLHQICGGGANAGAHVQAVTDIPAYASTANRKTLQAVGMAQPGTAAGDLKRTDMNLHWRSTAAITSLTLIDPNTGGGFATSAVFSLYGIK